MALRIDDDGGPFSSLPEDLDVLREVGINLGKDLGKESYRDSHLHTDDLRQVGNPPVDSISRRADHAATP
ncbi:hypothetical protein WKI65_19030 [Streptomyces sp. MS1.AVA.3]|uniref:hypothetical protein n=1 Tax=Streptomyces decoyicus TaxID=249567 RepID=UPI0030BCC7F5